ncbi:DNA mismatch repair protein MutS [Desulfobulbus rhabdoformis]|uniref:DNA mismatch repair protein MutS n=1 Tax=Desulfobulbus rhabdoformis TaxID=34032 RepID=UPI001964CED5|nr:DNA mismatch repair protein MutS [Desulfobulbus rhabdoformis]MBM9613410.1 DNA mismatch repair protein MutS [Desulfobulbus rhabdoformis]
MSPPKLTPMLQQYLEIKEQYPGTILFYRMGDFYEMFFEDAELASKVLGITLTSRSHKDDANKIPMCGVPFHAVSGYLGKMVKAGYRVAICEQVEDPKAAKGIVKREVIRVVSPGVTTEDQLLDAKNDCYVSALVLTKKSNKELLAGLAFVDISTGRFQLAEIAYPHNNPASLVDTFTRMRPAELLIAQDECKQLAPITEQLSSELGQLCLTPRPDFQFETEAATTTLTEHFKTSNLAGFGCDQFTVAINAAGALLHYLHETQKTELAHIKQLTPLHQSGYLIIDDSSRRNLELTETLIGGQRQGSLLAALDATQTPMGARLLRRWLLFPLQDKQSIEGRLESVEELIHNGEIRRNLQQLLSEVYDLERLCSRLVLGHGNARDMAAIKTSLAGLPSLHHLLAQCSAPLLIQMTESFDVLADLHELIDAAIRDDAPISLREGKLICEGYNEELDHLLLLLRDGKKLILDLETKERERSGISKLKVGYNKVFGYYFEVSRAQAANLPEDYIRKQTLVNAERFITPELKELENSIITAQDRRLELEYELFSEVREKLTEQDHRLLQTAEILAQIDVLTNFAELAVKHRYCRPTLDQSRSLDIQEGRHPVIERSLPPGRFVPNDVHLDQEAQEVLIITGPNMAGKSTVLRQTALIVLMAHIGSFVPAESAELCLVDRIFTRVGAMDDLRHGQSTFMVEMNETANILNNATTDSLVILDEIGRGTSTYDGLSIAWAVAEELAQKDKLGVKTLFATHYHELTDLAATNSRIKNFSIAVKEWNDTIIFLHKLIQGATNRSYGIQVASLAGVPDHVIKRASEILKNIELGEYTPQGEPKIAKSAGRKKIAPQPRQMALFAPPYSPTVDFLSSLQPDDMTPREALELLYKAVELAQKE